MDHFDIAFTDKNSERKMYAQRVKKISSYLSTRVFTDSETTGGFRWRDGQYKYSQLDEGTWNDFGEDDTWGYKEQYCWFRHTVTIPARFAGKPVVYDITPFPEKGWSSGGKQFIVYVSGEMVQGIDSNHTFIYLTNEAKGGEAFDIALNAYSDDWSYDGKAQLRATLRTVDTAVSDLVYDLSVPWEVAHYYDADAMPRIDIIKSLNEAVNLLELNTCDYDVFIDSVKAASAYIDENIFGVDSGVVTSAVGHTHIDTAWLWRLRQTRDKAGRSFATVINLMKEFPDYKFMSPQAQLYDFVKQDYPELYAQIKNKIKEGRWEAEGSMWVESDTNVISGESLVRQFLVGKRFFKSEFGVDNKIMWLPDVFGYSAALPQIMKLAGIDYFMTTKISWSEIDRVPFDTFTWQGIDGSSVLAHFIPSKSCVDDDPNRTTYNARLSPNEVMGGWRRYGNKDLNKNVLCSYGHGDGGGGPTRGMLENGMRMAKGIEGCPRVKLEFARDFFDRLEKDVRGNKRLPKWVGELYLEFHRGTLTSQSRNKKYNRKNELLYHDAETLCTLADKLCGEKYPADELLESWKIILLNQFHDIIPGSSIAQVYEDSKLQYEQILSKGKELTNGAVNAIASKINLDGDSLVVFNTLGFARSEAVVTDIISGDFAILDANGSELPHQTSYDGKLVFIAKDVPAKGYKTFRVVKGAKGTAAPAVQADKSGAQTPFFSLGFDENMNISSLVHKSSGFETVPAGKVINRLVAYEDRPHVYDAWDVKSYYGEKFWCIDGVDGCEVVESGSVRTVIKVTRKFNLSVIEQYFKFYNDIERIDIDYVVDWKERDIILKTDNPVDVNAMRATYDIQFGNIERTSHNNTTWDFSQFEACGHKWADLSDNSFGLSILNDCKYGWAIKEGSIKPSLLRSATTPNHQQDRETHTFTYALYPHEGAVSSSNVVNEAYSLNVPLYCTAQCAHGGELSQCLSMLSTDKQNIIIETVKMAEDSECVIVRMYETWNKKTVCTLDTGFDVESATQCDLLEENDEPLNIIDGKISLTFRPFEIKTVKLCVKGK